MIRKLLGLGLATALLGLVAGVPPAAATLTVPSASFTPSTTQAGGNPDLALNVELSTSNGDDLRDMTLSLAPGLFANPTAAPKCTEAELNGFYGCPPNSKVGSGVVTATAFGFPTFNPASLYLVEPRSGEAARLGLVITTGVGKIIRAAPVKLRTSPDIGIDIRFTDLPRAIGPVGLTINRIQLTIDRQPASDPFTRNPTSCGAAITKLTFVSYDVPGTPITKESQFTPTGCSTLAFTPVVGTAGKIDSPDFGVELTTSIAQDPGEAAVSSAAFTFPEELFARAETLGRACSAADPGTCPASANVGTATATTPLLLDPLVGRMVLLSRPVGLPGLAVVFPDPFPIRLTGETALDGIRLSASFAGVPDVPLDDLELKFTGGTGSLFFAGSALCTGSPVVTGSLAAHNAKTVAVNSPFGISGCPPPPPARTVAAPEAGDVLGASSPVGSLSLRSLAGRRPRLRFRVEAPAGLPALLRLDVALPHGLGLDGRRLNRDLRVAADGVRIRRAGRAFRGGLRIDLGRVGAREVVVTLGGPTLIVRDSLARKLKEPGTTRLAIAVTVHDVEGGKTRLRLRARAG